MEFHQPDTIPSFGFSMAVPQDMMTIDRGVFDPVPSVSDEENNYTAVGKKPFKKRRPAKAATATKKTKGAAKHASPKRQVKSRRTIPEIKTYIEEEKPRDVDVVSGRGGKSNNHPGNKACWLFMLELRPSYKAAGKDDKTKNLIARKVVDFVHQREGRYVQLDKDAGRWFILPDKSAMEKAKQTLRDSHVPDWVRNDHTTTTRKKKRSNNKPRKAAAETVTTTAQQLPTKQEEKPRPQADMSSLSALSLPPLQDTSFGTLGGLGDAARTSLLLSSLTSMDGLMLSRELSLASLSQNSLIAIGSFLGTSTPSGSSNKQEQPEGGGSVWDDMFQQQIRINPTLDSTKVVGV